MHSIQAALRPLPWHLLAIIGRQRGLGIDSNLKKADLIRTVAEALLDPQRLAQTLSGLDPDQAQCLTDLRRAGGQLPQPLLTRRYGDWRSKRS